MGDVVQCEIVATETKIALALVEHVSHCSNLVIIRVVNILLVEVRQVKNIVFGCPSDLGSVGSLGLVCGIVSTGVRNLHRFNVMRGRNV